MYDDTPQKIKLFDLRRNSGDGGKIELDAIGVRMGAKRCGWKRPAASFATVFHSIEKQGLTAERELLVVLVNVS